jgi:hypothetical protein
VRKHFRFDSYKEIPMKSKATACAFSAALILTAAAYTSPVQAEPCELVRNQLGGWFADCTLSDLVGKKYSATINVPSGNRFRLPDLIADKVSYYTSGTVVEIYARTANQGARDAQSYEVTAIVTISGGNMSPQMVSISSRAPALALGARQTAFVGYVSIPDRTYDYDLSVEIIADSANIATGGEIWEEVETNNAYDDGVCRIYGENPDLSVRACR